MNVHILEHPAGLRIILADNQEEVLSYMTPNEALTLGEQLIEAANCAIETPLVRFRNSLPLTGAEIA